MKRAIVSITLATFLHQAVGCTYHRAVPVPRTFPAGESLRNVHDRAFDSRKGWRILGYVTTDGVQHEFHGYANLLEDDILQFTPANFYARPTEAPREAQKAFDLPRREVSSLLVEDLTPVGQAGAFVGIVGTVAVATTVVLLIVASYELRNCCKNSCPLLSSWDGKRFVLDGEPYGGAISRGLERTDWSELGSLKEVDGKYRVLLTNEADETQHTNSMRLLVADHEPGTRVVIDREGELHAFRHVAPLAAARDERGTDLTRWLRETDAAAWYPDLEALAKQLPLSEVRDRIDLEFERPPGVQSAFLIANVATGPWGSGGIRSFLEMHGNRVQEFYAGIDGDPAARQALLDWNDREELFHLFVYVEKGGEWERQDFLPGGGPLVSESRAVRLDLHGVAGDRVRVRLNPPIGFWSLNSFELAWNEVSLELSQLEPESSVDERGSDVRAPLLADDDAYLDFPDTESQAIVSFAAPALRVPKPAAVALERTVFAQTRGWYELHLHERGEPDVAGLERIRREPGAFVQRSLAEYAALLRMSLNDHGARARGSDPGR